MISDEQRARRADLVVRFPLGATVRASYDGLRVLGHLARGDGTIVGHSRDGGGVWVHWNSQSQRTRHCYAPRFLELPG